MACRRPAACNVLPVLLVSTLFLGPLVMAALDAYEDWCSFSGERIRRLTSCICVFVISSHCYLGLP